MMLERLFKRRRKTPARDVIVHIGRHKTGTTAIQLTLRRNRSELLEKGILYSQDCASSPSHNSIAAHFLGNNKTRFSDAQAAEDAAAFRAAVDDHRGTVILSSEVFQGVPPRKLARYLEGTNPRIVVYIREQFGYAMSSYAQSVQSKALTETFEEFLDRFNPQYEPFLAEWANTFGRDNLTVRIYDRKRLVNADVVDDFFSVCGIDTDGLKRTNRTANPSIGGPLLDFKRAINYLDVADPQLQQLSYKSLARLVEKDPRYSARPACSAERAAAYRASFTEGNDRIAEQFGFAKPMFDLKPPDPVRETTRDEMNTVVQRLQAAKDPSLAKLLAETLKGRSDFETDHLRWIAEALSQ